MVIVKKLKQVLMLLTNQWDETMYLALYPHVGLLISAGAYRSGLDHFEKTRSCKLQADALAMPDLWNEKSYLRCYPKVASMVRFGAVANGYQHYINIGKNERKKIIPPKAWHELFYLTYYPAIADGVRIGEFQSGYEHYILHGINEARVIYRDPPKDWSEQNYSLLHPDVALEVQKGRIPNGWFHYLLYGMAENRNVSFPGTLLEGLREMAEIEPEVFPNRQFINSIYRHDADRPTTGGRIYYEVVKSFAGKDFTHVVICPWLKTGGADKVTVVHLQFLSADEKNKVLLIITENTDSPWINRVPDNITIVRADGRFYELDVHERKILLYRILTASKAKVLHVINSDIAWQLLREHGRALTTQFQIFASVFAFGVTSEGKKVGYATFVPDAEPYVANFITDNDQIIHDLRRIYGVRPEKFIKLNYPVKINPRFKWSGKSRNVLWASRFDQEKRPDILLHIIRNCPDIHFDIFGEVTISAGSAMQGFTDDMTKLGNATMHGKYDGFDSIPTDDYAVLLYTTESDGMPNVILEAHGAGLPVIAPDIGGIKAEIPFNSGFLISAFDDVKAYTNTLQKVLNVPLLAHRERNRVLEEITMKRSMTAFRSIITEIKGYGTIPSHNKSGA